MQEVMFRELLHLGECQSSGHCRAQLSLLREGIFQVQWHPDKWSHLLAKCHPDGTHLNRLVKFSSFDGQAATHKLKCTAMKKRQKFAGASF